MNEVSALAQAVRAGDRRALAKAITLVESSRELDRVSARELLDRLATGAGTSFRIGITGVPGAGKSTLIDGLGSVAIRAGRRVAVLAVDPSSRRSGGSILGDKTRMTRLAAEAAAFIRPSPTLGVLGGATARTREVISLCEAAGYDTMFVETVGVGQSEEEVASFVDCVLLVLLTGAGDELSSMKRGLLEAVDLIAFNKADGERASVAKNESASLAASLGISRSEHVPPVLVVSAQEGSGVAELWSAVASFQQETQRTGSFERRRGEQRQAWFGSALDEALRAVFLRRPDLIPVREAAERSVREGALSPVEAAERVLADILREPATQPQAPADAGPGR